MTGLVFALIGFWVLSVGHAQGAKQVVLPFSALHSKASQLGNRPRNLWTHGEFTAWGPVREGVFAASFPRLLSYTVLQKLAPFSVLPTEPIVQITICETPFPIPELREGRRFEITEEEPAKVLEMLQGNYFYARLRLSAAPKALWKSDPEEAGDATAEKSEDDPPATEKPERGIRGDRHLEKANGASPEPPTTLHFADIGRVWKERGTRPARTWVYGRFFVDTDVQNGLFTAHEAGLATRRVVEGLLASAAIFPFGERFDTAIFSSHVPGLQMKRKTVIEIDKEHAALVREIVPAGGLLVRLELKEEPEIEGPGGNHGAKDFFSPVVRLFSP
ncbi:hypothetical protein [Methylacidimicrobium tartarophylax]|uniref:Uncharacterized protein n=1 Tax=Methylacidimicrobium tartarophylax TaxID=1041768 RepID=A0A5E6MI61_9BACT|nr:hypothetical protein [Methylacidimicrobium tartarophylax]VVM07599.1 hypothetical protein MAMT_01823 [Methylacidimicrobium tartarophylax]